MELNWERSLPFIKIDQKSLEILFRRTIKCKDINSMKLIENGCRTTNYLVDCNLGRYILKIYYSDEQNYKKEMKILNMLKSDVPVQDIYIITRDSIVNNREYAIYDYLEGKTLSEYLNEGHNLNSEIVKSAALILAEVHKHKFSRAGFLDENMNVIHELQKFYDRYYCALNENACNRLGKDIIDKIEIILNEYKDKLNYLDNDIRLVHGDFQGNNLLVSDNKISGILDWEFSMAGHPLEDIGQFFRYEEYFNEQLINDFQSEYNKYSDYILDGDWYKMCKICDLINLIKLLGYDEDMPNKYYKLKELIYSTVARVL